MKTQTTSKKNTARLTAALFALLLLFPCCMDSGSGGSSDYDSGSNTENNGSWENPDDNTGGNSGNDDSTDDNGDDSGKTEPDEPNPDTPDDSEGVTEIDSNTDMSKLNPAKTYIFKATNGTVDAAKLVLAKKILGENLSFTETNVNYTLDFSNKSFANTTDEIESRSDFASTLANGVFTTNDYDKTITIGGVTFITHPVAKEGSDNRIQQAFQFDKDVKKVSVTFGDKYNMTEAYKGGIILNGGDNTELTLNNFENTTLTGDVYFESMGDFNVKTKKFEETTLISKLATGDTLPKTNNLFFGKVAEDAETFYGTGIDKIFENYYVNGASDKILVKSSSAPFNAKDALNGGYMYNENGSYNNAYNIDINIALLMAEKLTNEFENVNISGNVTSDVDTYLTPSNVRFSGDVSGLNFTTTSGSGLIDFAGVGPKSGITAVGAKVITSGLKSDGTEKYFSARVVDFYGVDETVLKKEVNINSGAIETVYSNKGSTSEFKEVSSNIKTFKSGSSASTNQAWEKKGRGETVSDSDLISKLDVKAKADNPLLQKLLDENRPVYG